MQDHEEQFDDSRRDGQAVLNATEGDWYGKGIFTGDANNLTFEYITFQNSNECAGNCAGIRMEGDNLTVRLASSSTTATASS